MKYLLLYVFVAFAAIGVLIGLNWVGLVTGRPMMAYAEDSRRLTFEHSRAHQSGVSSGIVDYCLDMRRAPDAASKAAIARFIISDADSFESPLPREAAACVNDAAAVLAN